MTVAKVFVSVVVVSGGFCSLCSLGQTQTLVSHDATGNRSTEYSSQPMYVPSISGQPQAILGQVGGTYRFSVAAIGINLSYQWYKDGSAISGATSDTLVISNAQATDFTNHAASTGLYSVRVSNAAGMVTSGAVALWLDTDGVGIPDWWQQQYFQALGIASGADPDGDGMTNLQEYLDGTDPTNAASANFTLSVSGPVTVQPVLKTYPPGTVVTLSLTGGSLQNWAGDASGSANPLTVTMTRTKSIQAVTTELPNEHFPTSLSTASYAYIRALLVQSNGQIVAGGRFDTFLGSPQWNLGRINANGTLDATFFPGAQSHFSGTIYDMVQQLDGKVIVVGTFYHSSPVLGANPPNYIARLNVDGTLDDSFMAAGQSVTGAVYAVALQGDGRIVIGGNFYNAESGSAPGLARLNADGTPDTSFVVGSGLSGTISLGCLQIDGSGNIYVGGVFSSYNGTAVSNVVRVTSNGALDTTFATGTGFDSVVETMALRPSGGIYAGGYFTHYQGVAANEIVALTGSGAIDPTFNAGSAASSGAVIQISLQADNKLLLARSDNYWQGQTRTYALRLNPSGSVDTSFAPQLNSGLYQIVPLSNGKIVIGGYFSTVNGLPRANLAQLNSDGSLDTPSYHVGTVSYDVNNVLAQQSDGKLLVAGSFHFVGNAPVPGFVRLNTDGSSDSSFKPGTGPSDVVHVILPLQTGKSILGGAFSNYNGSSVPYCARINSDGTLDTVFGGHLGTGPNETVWGAAMQSSGQIVIVGSFTTVNGQTHNHIARLNADGSLDASFTASTDQFMQGVAIDAQDNIVIGGSFRMVDGQSISYFARLKSDGSVDGSFNPPVPNGYVSGVALCPGGQILIRGGFSQVGSTSQNGLARFSSTGTLDPAPGSNDFGTVYSFGVQSDGSIVVGSGNYFTIGGTTYQYFCRLNPSGIIDPFFDPNPTSAVYSLLIGSNDDIYALGAFNSDVSEYAVGIAHYVSAPNLSVTLGGTSPSYAVNAGTPITLSGSASTSTGFVTSADFLYSTDGINFRTAASGAYQGGGAWIGVWAPPASGIYYLRLAATDSTGEYGISSLLAYAANSGPPQIAAPSLSIGSGAYASPQSVTLSSSSPGAQIFYTTDNTDPADSPTRIFLGSGGTILISQSTTVYAQTFYRSGGSSMSSATYTIGPIPVPAMPRWVLLVLALSLLAMGSRLLSNRRLA